MPSYHHHSRSRWLPRGPRKGPPVLAAVTRSPGEMVVEDVSGPGPARAGNVIVRPEAVGICGSDFHLFSGDVGALSGGRDFYPGFKVTKCPRSSKIPGKPQTYNRASGSPSGRCCPAAAVIHAGPAGPRSEEHTS